MELFEEVPDDGANWGEVVDTTATGGLSDDSSDDSDEETKRKGKEGSKKGGKSISVSHYLDNIKRWRNQTNTNRHWFCSCTFYVS